MNFRDIAEAEELSSMPLITIGNKIGHAHFGFKSNIQARIIARLNK